MEFIDLFAGLGGFHLALKRLGHTCVFASEIDKGLQELYELNYGIKPMGDIRTISVTDIPCHDILCAGFPCQPFSKAGEQQGFACPKWGDLFGFVLQIIQYHKPQFFMLENVPNLEHHDKGRTWHQIRSALIEAGYEVQYKRLSPHRFGIPQIRERMFIVGSKSNLVKFDWPHETPHAPLSIIDALETHPPDARKLSPHIQKCIEVWQEFLDHFPKNEELPSFPIWSMEFGATYPFEESTPYASSVEELRSCRGSHGRDLSDISSSEEIMKALPSHARTEQLQFPKWKIRFIQQNRDFYHKHQSWIDEWMPKILEFPSSLQKLEWNCKGEKRNIWDFVIQLRASGVRIKRPTTSPSLISASTRQVPIIAWEKRHMTQRECAGLQSMQELRHLPPTPERAFKALGNAVNVNLVEMVAKALLNHTSAVIIENAVPSDDLEIVVTV